MAEKFSVLDQLEVQYWNCVETRGEDPNCFYMNENMSFVLYNEVMMESAQKLEWDEVKKVGLHYRGIQVKITDSLYMGEIIAM